MKKILAMVLMTSLLLSGAVGCHKAKKEKEIVWKNDELLAPYTYAQDKEMEIVEEKDGVRSVYFYRGELKIYGKIYTPTGTGAFPVVVITGGSGAPLSTHESLAKELAANGIIGVVYDACGAISGSKSDGHALDYTVLTHAADLEAILRALVKLPYVDPNNLFLWGHSFGGMVAGYVACTNPEMIQGMVFIDEKTPLLVLAGPMFFELFLNTMLNNVDTIMLSHYDQNAVGAVGNANTIMFMMNILFNVIATATSVVVAQYLGAKLFEKMNKIYTLSVAVNLVIGVFFSAVFCLANPLIMTLLHVSAEMRPYSMIYIYIVGGGGFLTAVFNVMLQILRCNGHTKIGMRVTFVINVINIIGNYIFLYGPLSYLDIGVAGVAISTVFARLIAVIAVFVFFYKKKIGKIALRYLRPFPRNLLMKMIKIGLPTAGENLTYNLYQTTLLSFVNAMGNDAVNARAYCNTLISFAMIFSNASAMATQIITGHLVGAGKSDAAYKRVFKTLKTSMPITIGLATINALLCRYTLQLFTDNPHIIALGQMIMVVDIFVEIGRCLNMTFVCSLKAAGAVFFPLIVGLICNWGLGLSAGYIFGVALGIGVAGIFIGTATDECIRGLIVMYYWYKKKWFGKAVVDKHKDVLELEKD